MVINTLRIKKGKTKGKWTQTYAFKAATKEQNQYVYFLIQQEKKNQSIKLKAKKGKKRLYVEILPTVESKTISSLIENSYILFGILGLVLIFGIIIKEVKNRAFSTK